MGNEALNKLRKQLDYSDMGLVDKAIAFAVEEATAKPERQFAEHQARLMKAKADLAEMEADSLRRRSSLFYNPETGEFLDGEGNVVNAPSETLATQQARAAKAKADLLELQLAERRGELVKVSDVEKQVELHFDGLRFAFVGDAVEYKHYFAEPSIVASILADQRAKRDERRESGSARQEELRIEELRGFYRGCNQALRIVLAEHDDHLGSVTRSALSCVANAIRHARKEG